MGCASTKPQVLEAERPAAAGEQANGAAVIAAAGASKSEANGVVEPVSVRHNTVVIKSFDSNKPSTTGVALEYLRVLVTTSAPGALAADVIGDHEEFCYKLSNDPSLTNFLKKKADVFCCFPPACTIVDLVHALQGVSDPSVFIWIDGFNVKSNGVNRTQDYWKSLYDIYCAVGKGIVVASPWSEPCVLSAARCVELLFAKTSSVPLLVAASKRECEEFQRELQEKPVGPSRFQTILDHSVEDTSVSNAISEILRERFVDIKVASRSLFDILTNNLAEELVNEVVEEGDKHAIVVASRGSLCYACNDLDEAMKCYQEAHSLALKMRNEPLAASLLHNIGKIYEERGQLHQAIELYERCLAVEESVSKLSLKLSTGDLLGQRTPTNQATSTRNGEKAFWRDSFTIPSPHDIGGAITALNLACILTETKEFDRAESLFVESLQARQTLATNGESLDVAWCLNSMGVFYERIGKRDQAREHYEKALELRRKLDANEVQLSESLVNLGGFYVAGTEQLKKAKLLLDEALALRIKSHGINSSLVAETLLLLAQWYIEQNDVDRAQRLGKEASDIFHKCDMTQVAQSVLDHFRISST